MGNKNSREDIVKRVDNQFKVFAEKILLNKMTITDWKVLSVMSDALIKSSIKT